MAHATQLVQLGIVGLKLVEVESPTLTWMWDGDWPLVIGRRAHEQGPLQRAHIFNPNATNFDGGSEGGGGVGEVLLCHVLHVIHGE